MSRKQSGKSGKRGKPGDQLRQVAALPYIRKPDGRVLVLVMTSRQTRRPVIPKGWRMKGRKDREAAAIEAFQEAGVVGKPWKKPAGKYLYWKRLPDRFALVRVHVYPLEVAEQAEDWPEKDEREFAWLTPLDAALLVDEPQLKSILRAFSQKSAEPS